MKDKRDKREKKKKRKEKIRGGTKKQSEREEEEI